jgi:DnaK suppressor protein
VIAIGSTSRLLEWVRFGFALAAPARALAAVHTACMDTAHARELLARERARIEHALAQLTPPDTEAVVDVYEATDVSEDMFNEELDEDRAAHLREELDAIERAEERLTQGTYGVSVDSGEQIPDARLEAIPWAERTAEEQARYDASGG